MPDRQPATRGRLPAATARTVDPWADIPLPLRRYWSVLVLAALVAAAGLRWGWAGLSAAASVTVVSWAVLPAPVNLAGEALFRLRRPDGAPRQRARRFRRTLAGCPGVTLPARLRYTAWLASTSQGVEIFEVRLWPGEHLGRWSGWRTEALRTAFGAEHAEVTEPRPGRVQIRFYYPSTRPMPPAPHLARTETDVLAEPVPLGRTATGQTITVPLAETNLLVAGIPGTGKSTLLQLVTAWAALDPWCSLVLLDGKGLSELGRWAPVAAGTAGTVPDATALLRHVETERRRRQDARQTRGLRIWRPGEVPLIVVVIDELAVFTDTTGLTGDDKRDRAEFSRLLVDLVRLGRADRIVVVAATQRPSADVVPTAFRDLVGVRIALRYTTREQSEIALGAGASAAGADATTLPAQPGHLIVRGATTEMQRGQAHWLDDRDLDRILTAARTLRHGRPAPPRPPPASPPRPAPRQLPAAAIPNPESRPLL